MRNHANSAKKYEQAVRLMPGGVNSGLRNVLPRLVFERAAGALLVDADGNEYIDFHCAFGPPVLGHNHPRVLRKVKEALEKCLLPGAGVTQLEIDLARKIHQHVPSAEKVLLSNSGTEAVLHALRVARAVTGRKKIVKFQGCYHGFYDSVLCNVLSPPDRVGRLHPGSSGILPEALENTLVCHFNSLDSVERVLALHPGQVAAIIVEPVAHNMGCVLPKPGFLEGLRELSRSHGALLIFDEVITGFRHHLGGYQAQCGVTPDLSTLGKSMANGFPIAAVCGKAEIMDRFSTRPGGDTYFAGTYNGNAIGCAAALATIEALESEPVHARLASLGERVCRELRGIHQRLGVPATVAGYQSIFLTYFMEGPLESFSDVLRNDASRFVDYRRRLIERGIFEVPLSPKRNHLSYSHTDQQIDRALEACEDVLKEMFGRPGQ